MTLKTGVIGYGMTNEKTGHLAITLECNLVVSEDAQQINLYSGGHYLGHVTRSGCTSVCPALTAAVRTWAGWIK